MVSRRRDRKKVMAFYTFGTASQHLNGVRRGSHYNIYMPGKSSGKSPSFSSTKEIFDGPSGAHDQSSITGYAPTLVMHINS